MGIIVVYDVTDRQSFENVRRVWIKNVNQHVNSTVRKVLVANKIDLDPHISEPDLIRELNLDYITENPWIVIPVSALKVINIDQVLSWLIKQGSANK